MDLSRIEVIDDVMCDVLKEKNTAVNTFLDSLVLFMLSKQRREYESKEILDFYPTGLAGVYWDRFSDSRRAFGESLEGRGFCHQALKRPGPIESRADTSVFYC